MINKIKLFFAALPWRVSPAFVVGAGLVYALYSASQLLRTDKTALEHFGQMGDFVGGIMNPLISFMALLWLMNSVAIQKVELNDTKIALKDQAKYAHIQVRISAIGTLLDACNERIAHRIRQKLNYEEKLQQAAREPDKFDVEVVEKMAAWLEQERRALMVEYETRDHFVTELQELLDKHPLAT